MKETLKKVVKKSIRSYKHAVNSFFLKENSLVILLYHRISPDNEANLLGTVINDKIFENQMQYLKERYEITTLKKCYAEGVNSSKNLRVAITFDDGYADNFKYAFPILKKLNISATFFLATDYVDLRKPIWDQNILTILNESKHNLRIEDLDNQFLLERGSDHLEDDKFLWKAINYLKFINPTRRNKILDPIFSSFDEKIDFSLDRCLSWDEVKTMKEGGMHFGSHGCSHSSLIQLSDKEIEKEILDSKRILEEELSDECMFFALPFGSQTDFNQRILKKVQDLGYLRCLLNIRNNNLIDSNEFSLWRKYITSSFDLDHICG